MKYILSILIVLTGSVAIAQNLDVIDHAAAEFSKLKSNDEFFFLNEDQDTTAVDYVATYSITSPPKSFVEKIFHAAEDRAKKDGANGLRLVRIADDYTDAVFRAYHMNDGAIEKHKIQTPKNVVFVFAGEKYDNPMYHTFEFNGAAKSIKNGTYFKYTLKEGEQAKLKKGTVAGTIMWAKWRQQGLPTYVSIDGFYAPPVVKRTTQSPSGKQGKFYTVDSALGAFLVRVLQEKVE